MKLDPEALLDRSQPDTLDRRLAEGWAFGKGREELRLSRAEFAQHVEVTEREIADLELGLRSIRQWSLPKVKRLQAALRQLSLERRLD